MRKPDKRLCAAAELVRQGAVFADIGTDHALLPVFLCETGRIVRAVAADINEGPLAAARVNVAAAGLSDKISLFLTDGLDGLEGEGLTDIAICGMGGDLMIEILSRAAFVKNEAVRLILQPMTHAADLRRFLAREGFRVSEERTASAKGRVYFCLAAEYCGEPYSLTRTEAEFGQKIKDRESEELCSLMRREASALSKKCRGLRKKGTPDAEEEAYLLSLSELIKELES